jgi:glycosyltransferase involved in cell wall biosynthesis
LADGASQIGHMGADERRVSFPTACYPCHRGHSSVLQTGLRVKVLLANKFFFGNGGSEAVMFHERDFLRASGVQVVDFAMDDPRNRPSPYASTFVKNQSYAGGAGNGTSRLRTAWNLIHSSEAVHKIGAVIEQTQPDLVHCHNIYHQLTPSIIGAAKRRGVPVVLTLHDYKPVCPTYLRLRDGHVCSECLEHGFSRVVRNRCAEDSLFKSGLLYVEAVVQRLLGNYEKLDAIIAPSTFMRDSVARRFPVEKVAVIHNGVDIESTRASDEDGNYALYLGRLSSEKGIETMLEAHSSIAERVPLVVAGTGQMEGELRARFPRARFVGHLTGKDLEQTIRCASLVVVPSNWYENCPMSVLEAMAFGKAVVGSAIGGIPELVVHGETGLLFPAGDVDALQRCLMDLMANREMRRKFGIAGRKRVEENFSLERHNTALMRLYERVIAGSKGVVQEAEPVRIQV